MLVLTNTALLHSVCLFEIKSILLSLLKNTSVALLYSLSVRFSSINKSFSMDMEANAESHFCPVMFLA